MPNGSTVVCRLWKPILSSTKTLRFMTKDEYGSLNKEETYLNHNYNGDKEQVFLFSDWYATLTPQKKEVMDYFQVFEY